MEHNGGRVAVVQIRASLVPAVAHADVQGGHNYFLRGTSLLARLDLAKMIEPLNLPMS